MNQLLDAFTLPICLARPHRRSGLSAAWVEHIPFGMNLVAVLRPSTLVELGTHGGDSYCAFCQAVVAERLPTRCYAVDTWSGDSQSGQYGPDVLADLHAHHDPLYGGFSSLIQATFDQARAHFAEGSVDLLHIDGLHTLEAVEADLAGWLPKVSATGVVVMHDINVRERDFGVWRAWEALKQKHPHFEFLHGHGLGIVAPNAVPEPLGPLFAASPADATVIRHFFFELGQRMAAVEREQVHLADRARLERAYAEQLAAEVRKRRDDADQARAREEALGAEIEAACEENAQLRNQVFDLERQAAALQQILHTSAWRAVNTYWLARDRVLRPGGVPRRLFDRATRVLKGKSPLSVDPDRPPNLDEQYVAWLTRNGSSRADRLRMRSEALRLASRPLVSVLTPVYDIDEAWLRRCIESVQEQVYENWELCLVDDASTQPHVARVLAEYAASDRRIRVERLERNSGIVAASARALSMARGEFVALLDHDDELAPDALLEVVKLLGEHPELDLIYTDEDKLDATGRRVEPFFKPDWSPDLLLSINYVCHLSVYRRAVLDEVGGFRPGFDGSQDYDLVLRFTERTQRIGHIAKILYHWRKVPRSTAAVADAKPYAFESAQKALREALVRRGLQGEVTMSPPGMYTVRYAINSDPLVSIIIPTKDKAGILRTAIDSIERRSTWKNRELLVVDNGSAEPESLRYLRDLEGRHRVLPYAEPFNWSSINNFAAKHACGEYLLFLNNDIEVIAPDWIEAMLEHAQRPGVGAVGAKLLYPTRTIQHAGVVVGVGGVANHAFRRLPAQDSGYFGLPMLIRNCSAVTGACMMVRAELFRELGGFDEGLRVAFNDIDFCLRLRARGLYVVYTPHALLYHHESATRGTLHPPEDERLMRERWPGAIERDPFYNPNLTQKYEDYRLRA
jgi:GT2 family glycosyltransferase